MKAIGIIILMISGASLFAQSGSMALKGGLGIENLKREDYTITDKVTGSSQSNRMWILFIPLPHKSNNKREEQAYNRALKKCGCDGLIQPQYKTIRIPVPLIVFTYVYKKTIVSGKGYIIKKG